MHTPCEHKPHKEESCVHKQNKDKIKSYSGNKKLDYIMSYITMCSMYNMDINVDKKVYDDAQDPNINLSTFVTNIDNNSGVDASICHDMTHLPRPYSGVACMLYHDIYLHHYHYYFLCL